METTRKYYPYGCKFLYEDRSTRNGSVFKAGKFEFECFWRSNRSGFVHEGDLYFNGDRSPSASSKIQYYNRTRERFSYESLMQDLFCNFIARQSWKFMEENKEEIMKISEDLNLNYGKIFKDMDLKEKLIEENKNN